MKMSHLTRRGALSGLAVAALTVATPLSAWAQ
jgi:hypothetical protein